MGGPSNFSNTWSHSPKMAIVSYTSTNPPDDVDNPGRLCILSLFGLPRGSSYFISKESRLNDHIYDVSWDLFPYQKGI